jgi:cytochrome c biogenesis protein CcmG, thiol:disulfide interchange protein DsbE
MMPVLAFAGLALIFFKGLSGDPAALPSTLIGKPTPIFTLSGLDGEGALGLSDADLRRGHVTLVNIWASWCGPCRQEHPILMELAKRDDISLVGINNKDGGENARRFLGAMGNPFSAIGADTDGRVSIDFGGYGVPETFIVDGTGHIRFKHVGPLAPEDVAGEIATEIEKAKTPL